MGNYDQYLIRVIYNQNIYRKQEPSFFLTKCLRIRQCPELLKNTKDRRKIPFCSHSVNDSESLVCCSHDEYKKSREFLRSRPQIFKIEKNYFDFDNCMRRDAMFKSDTPEGKIIRKMTINFCLIN